MGEGERGSAKRENEKREKTEKYTLEMRRDA